MIGRLGRPGGLLLLFGVVSLAAVATGAWVSAASGVPASLWVRNLAAWVVGALAAAGIAVTLRRAALPWVLWAAPAGLLASLFGRDQLGVHRWIDLGPLHMNAAMLLLPGASVALAATAGDRRWPWLAILASLALLIAQPDASQATTLAIVAAAIALAAVRPKAAGVALSGTAGALAAAAWLRPDPLPPVPEVEEILKLAFAMSPLAGGLAALLLLAVAAAPVLATATRPGASLAGRALGLCFLAWAIMPLLGAFPVPLVGIGLSPILGAWLGAGVLAAVLRLARD